MLIQLSAICFWKEGRGKDNVLLANSRPCAHVHSRASSALNTMQLEKRRRPPCKIVPGEQRQEVHLQPHLCQRGGRVPQLAVCGAHQPHSLWQGHRQSGLHSRGQEPRAGEGRVSWDAQHTVSVATCHANCFTHLCCTCRRTRNAWLSTRSSTPRSTWAWRSWRRTAASQVHVERDIALQGHLLHEYTIL